MADRINIVKILLNNMYAAYKIKILEENTAMSDKAKKICFVVTPIGDKDSSIRRHIDGIIDHAIIPALEDKYEVEVAHRKYEIGSINDRIINSIFEADLVIANLTSLNPNVMFELAIRYSFGKPAIVIAERSTQLPFDIIDENTIFYDNDPTGAFILKEQLIKFENNIDYTYKKYGPVFKAINTVALYEEVESGQEIPTERMFRHIIDRLDAIETTNKHSRVDGKYKAAKLFFPVMDEDEYIEKIYATIELFQKNNDIEEISHHQGAIFFVFKNYIFESKIESIIEEFMNYIGYPRYESTVIPYIK